MTDDCTANLRLWRARSRRIIVAAIVAALTCAYGDAQAESAAQRQQLLADAGITAEELRVFDDWDGKLTEEQAGLAARLLYRLDQRLALGETFHQVQSPALAALEPGQLAPVTGRASEVTRSDLPDAARAALEQDQLFHIQIELADGSTASVLSRRIPGAWTKRSLGQLAEPVTFQGVLVGSAGDDVRQTPLFIASRFEWRPEANVSAGVAWLVERGFDAALLDEVRHGRAFAKAHESLEGLAFYQCLAIVADSRPEGLVLLAREALPAKAKEAGANLADATADRESLTAKWEGATTAERRQLQKELKAVRRREAIAAGVVERADRGTSSVAPLFLEPQQNTGEAVLIEGTARRATRIVLNEEASRAAQRAATDADEHAKSTPLKEYYELDVFTTDSQNLPIICCVARLPEGFPTGEAIREPVRVGGIFFKQWSYIRRADNEAVSPKNRPPERLHPPLIIAAAPQWLRTAAPTTPQNRGLWAGLAFLAVFLTVILALVRVSRRDRLAQVRRARYDSSLENIAEP